MRLQIAGSRVQITVGTDYFIGDSTWMFLFFSRSFISQEGATLSLAMTKASSFLRRGNVLRRRPANRSASILAPNPTVDITTLPNNIRVATENTPGHFSSVGLYIDAGSRYETPEISGVSHFLDRMAFKVRSCKI